ncbi:MAG: peptidoglycan DD-metalloendopeptidase family protein [Bacteroidota bacterium]
MQLLNDQQILFIESRLTEEGLEHTALREELLDHICCAVEAKMQRGISFHNAVNATFDTFGEQGIQDIQEKVQQIGSRKMISKRVALLLLLPLLFISSYCWWVNKALYHPDLSPIAGEYHISSTFGERLHPIYNVVKHHNGIDISVPTGTPIIATASGTVILLDDNPYDGQKIVIKHSESYTTVYSQLSRILIQEGQNVNKGEVIGYSGDTGLSTRPHLHYEIIQDDQYVDPQDFLRPNSTSSP